MGYDLVRTAVSGSVADVPFDEPVPGARGSYDVHCVSETAAGVTSTFGVTAQDDAVIDFSVASG